MYKKLLALATFVGTIIGVGLFGLPYAAAQVGFIPMIMYMVILTGVVMLMHLMYGEITVRATGNHRLPGYAQQYLGYWQASISYISSIIGLTGSLVAYVLVGGSFISQLISPIFGGNTTTWSIAFWLIGSILIIIGTSSISLTEFLSLGLFFLIFGIIGLHALPAVNPTYLFTWSLHANNILLPYGIILFSLTGASIIPEIKEILKGHRRSLKHIIILSTIISAITYLIFCAIVLGVTGSATTPEAMTGLYQALGPNIIRLGFIFGITTTFTSFIALGITLRKTFQYDLRLPRWLSIGLACLPSLLLFLSGLKDFISLIAFLGIVTVGLDTVITSWLYIVICKQTNAKEYYHVWLPKALVVIVATFLLFGVGLELSHSLR